MKLLTTNSHNGIFHNIMKSTNSRLNIITAIFLLLLIGLLPVGVYLKNGLINSYYGSCCLPKQCNIIAFPNTSFWKDGNRNQNNMCVLSTADMITMNCLDVQNCSLSHDNTCYRTSLFNLVNSTSIITIITGVFAIICLLFVISRTIFNDYDLSSVLNIFMMLFIIMLVMFGIITCVLGGVVFNNINNNSIFSSGRAMTCVQHADPITDARYTVCNSAILDSINNNSSCPYAKTTAIFVNWFLIDDQLKKPIYYTFIVTSIVACVTIIIMSMIICECEVCNNKDDVVIIKNNTVLQQNTLPQHNSVFMPTVHSSQPTNHYPVYTKIEAV